MAGTKLSIKIDSLVCHGTSQFTFYSCINRNKGKLHKKKTLFDHYTKHNVTEILVLLSNKKWIYFVSNSQQIDKISQIQEDTKGCFQISDDISKARCNRFA
jgi:hypothetical protein